MREKVWLMPFASVSLAVYWKLRKQQTEVAGFIDNAKGGTGLIFDGLPVAAPKDIDRGSTVLISSLKHSEKMKSQLIAQGFDGDNIQFTDGFLITEDIVFAKNEAKRRNIEGEYPIKQMDKAFDFYVKLIGIEDRLMLNGTLEVVVTQRCNLKCKECANLMQYYTNPRHCDLQTVLKSIDRIFGFLDYVTALNVLGGEPFLVKELYTVLDKLAEYRDKCGSMMVITNGTIIPSAEVRESIKRANARVVISDYGPISRRKDDLTEILEREGIQYSVHFTDQPWKKRDYFTNGKAWTDDEANALFGECRANCKEIINGRLGWCVYITHGESLRAFPKETFSSLDLLDEGLTKKQVADYFFRKEAFSACKYCKGVIGAPEYIPVAEQADGPLPYTICE